VNSVTPVDACGEVFQRLLKSRYSPTHRPIPNRIWSAAPGLDTLVRVGRLSPSAAPGVTRFMHTLQMVNSFRVPWGTLMSYIPVIATIVTTFFSIVLARATLRQVEATDKGLALAREEFEREWNPDLHIKLERASSEEARVIVTNLAKTSVLLQLLQLRKLSHAMPFERCRLNDPLVGGMTWSQEMGKRILGCTGYEFEGPLAASVTFYAAGRMYRTDWFRAQIVVREGRIVSLEPSTMPSRRVRQIERKGPERRREFVQDVAGGGDTEDSGENTEDKASGASA
jgi:hypothetical protein